MWSRGATVSRDAVKDFLKSESKISLGSAKEKNISTVSKLVKEAQEAKEAVVFTWTSGPFKPNHQLPASWTKTLPVNGCTNQLNAMEELAKQLKGKARFYGINKHSSDYHCGPDGLMAQKGWSNFEMISDKDGEAEKLLKYKTIEVDGKQYDPRFTLVVRPDGYFTIIELGSPVTVDSAKTHADAISGFLTKDFTNENRPGSPLSWAAAAR